MFLATSIITDQFTVKIYLSLDVYLFIYFLNFHIISSQVLV